MEVFYIILHVAVVVLLLLVMGMHPYRTTMSQFELRRRSKAGDGAAQKVLEREGLIDDIYSLQRAVVAILLVLVSFIGVLAYHWVVGLLVALLIALEAGAVAHLSFVQRRAQLVYDKIEPSVLGFIKKHPALLRMIRIVVPSIEESSLDSREELEHLVDGAGDILTDDEKTMIRGSLQFSTKTVHDVMTPRAVVDTISADETLGPLVLDDLHKTGHSRFPVVEKDIDHVVGMLYVQNLLIVGGGQQTLKASKAMDPHVYYIREDHTLDYALAGFLRTHHHLFIVVNEFRETVGVVSLEDVLEVLIGRKIIDEFDAHDDLRAVAARNPRSNNKPKTHTDI